MKKLTAIVCIGMLLTSCMQKVNKEDLAADIARSYNDKHKQVFTVTLFSTGDYQFKGIVDMMDRSRHDIDVIVDKDDPKRYMLQVIHEIPSPLKIDDPDQPPVPDTMR